MLALGGKARRAHEWQVGFFAVVLFVLSACRSHDTTVMVWDISGGQGNAFELCGHTFDATYHMSAMVSHAHRGKVQGLVYVPEHKKILSFGQDGIIIAWEMATAPRQTVHVCSVSKGDSSCGRPRCGMTQATVSCASIRFYGMSRACCRSSPSRSPARYATPPWYDVCAACLMLVAPLSQVWQGGVPCVLAARVAAAQAWL